MRLHSHDVCGEAASLHSANSIIFYSKKEPLFTMGNPDEVCNLSVFSVRQFDRIAHLLLLSNSTEICDQQRTRFDRSIVSLDFLQLSRLDDCLVGAYCIGRVMYTHICEVLKPTKNGVPLEGQCKNSTCLPDL